MPSILITVLILETIGSSGSSNEISLMKELKQDLADQGRAKSGRRDTHNLGNGRATKGIAIFALREESKLKIVGAPAGLGIGIGLPQG